MFNERLKQLRIEKNLTQAKLAVELGIGKTTLASYEQGKNEPSIKTLAKISNYFHVSIDYLLGLTTVKSTNIDISYMSNYLGLTEKSIAELNAFCNIANNPYDIKMKQKLDTLNLLLSSNCDILDKINDYLNFSATHFRKYNDESINSLIPISELELWDDYEKVGYSDDWDLWTKALLVLLEEELIETRNQIQYEKYKKNEQHNQSIQK